MLNCEAWFLTLAAIWAVTIGAAIINYVRRLPIARYPEAIGTKDVGRFKHNAALYDRARQGSRASRLELLELSGNGPRGMAAGWVTGEARADAWEKWIKLAYSEKLTKGE